MLSARSFNLLYDYECGGLCVHGRVVRFEYLNAQAMSLHGFEHRNIFDPILSDGVGPEQ